jgi:hypothetical protein
LAAEDEKREAAGECCKDQELGIGGVFQIARQFASRPATPGLARGKATFDEPSAFEEIEHADPLLA